MTAPKLACISLYGQHRVHRSEVGLFLVLICELPVRLQVTQDFLLGSHHDVEGVLEATRGGREEIWSLVAGRVRVQVEDSMSSPKSTISAGLLRFPGVTLCEPVLRPLVLQGLRHGGA